MRHIIFALIFIFTASSSVFAGGEELILQTTNGKHSLRIELVNTPQSRATGLMYRTAMPADTGMLFDFGQSAPVSMWMKNTIIPLDMLFVRKDGVIITIVERTVPYSLASVDSNGPVLAVLELNGGSCARLGVKVGDRLLHPLFGTAPAPGTKP